MYIVYIASYFAKHVVTLFTNLQLLDANVPTFTYILNIIRKLQILNNRNELIHMVFFVICKISQEIDTYIDKYVIYFLDK